MRRTAWAGFLGVALCAVACGGSTIDPGDGGGGDSGQQDAAPDTWGPYPCGSTTCGSGEICVHPCCGGAPPPCEPPLDDAGTCPPGTFWGQCMYPSYGQGCVQGPCTPPPPYCAPASDPQNSCTPTYQNQPRDCYEMCA